MSRHSDEQKRSTLLQIIQKCRLYLLESRFNYSYKLGVLGVLFAVLPSSPEVIPMPNISGVVASVSKSVETLTGVVASGKSVATLISPSPFSAISPILYSAVPLHSNYTVHDETFNHT